MFRKTIATEASYTGLGVYSGKVIKVTLKPAKCGDGIRIIRDDCKENNVIIVDAFARYEAKNLNTKISNGYVEVLMIEHLMATIWNFRITDLEIHIDANEVPMLDGSARYWVRLIKSIGVKNFDGIKKPYKFITNEIAYSDGDVSIFAKPYDRLKISYTIDFAEKSIGKNTFIFDENDESFFNEIAPARTFCTAKQVKRHMDIKKAFNDYDMVVFDDNSFQIADHMTRYSNEPTRHKILDLIGDLMSSGEFICGEFFCNNSGHATNRAIINKIFSVR